MNYDSSLKYKWDNENVMEYAIQQAVQQTRVEDAIIAKKEKEEAIEQARVEKEEAIEQARVEKDREKEEAVQQTAKKLKNLGISIVAISSATGLSEATIEKL